MERKYIPDLQYRLQEKDYKTTITLKEYLDILEDEGSFIIPDYQRGYVWGQKKKNVPVDSITYLIQTLKEGMQSKKDIFLQGITVHEKPNSYDIVLVDGQQRTTFFYLLLKYLGYDKHLCIKYDIREESNEYLGNKTFDDERDDEEEYQDIFFFKRTLRFFKRDFDLSDEGRADFMKYILEHVKFLFVVIPEDQAKIVFTMMNGNKANMTDEELIKAELLRCASLKHELINEAEHSALRSRLAREWDQWLYWWNQTAVKTYFRTGGKQLGWLLPLICENSRVSFRKFLEKLIPDSSMKQSKRIFKRMRLLQKSIEDLYNNSRSYNYAGLILYICNNSEQIFSFLRWYLNINSDDTHTKSEEELKRYYDWSIIGVNHEDIVARRIDKYNEARNCFLEELKSNTLFLFHYETAYRWLIRQNIKQDNHFTGRTFNFEIERERSIEHVYPKSKVGHRTEEGNALNWNDEPIENKDLDKIMLWREDMKWFCEEENREYKGSEHCIGNLLLLYKRDNSKFNDADFRKKNEYFFTTVKDEEAFKSRHLIHTTMIFSDVNWEDKQSGTPWNKEQVSKRKYAEIKDFEQEYPELTD